jgi:hypothetical protein
MMLGRWEAGEKERKPQSGWAAAELAARRRQEGEES